jgi:hypothetical protein
VHRTHAVQPGGAHAQPAKARRARVDLHRRALRCLKIAGIVGRAEEDGVHTIVRVVLGGGEGQAGAYHPRQTAVQRVLRARYAGTALFIGGCKGQRDGLVVPGIVGAGDDGDRRRDVGIGRRGADKHLTRQLSDRRVGSDEREGQSGRHTIKGGSKRIT